MNEIGAGAFREELYFAGYQVAKAWQMLHDPKVTSNMRSKEYMELCRDAGLGEQAVQKAGNQWANMRLDKGLEP